jgi:hypothetical protein
MKRYENYQYTYNLVVQHAHEMDYTHSDPGFSNRRVLS